MGGSWREATFENRVLRAITRDRRLLLLLVAGAATVLFNVVLTLLDRELEATGGPSILGLEFAGSLRRVEEISVEWGSHGLSAARLSLWIDFGFMVSYGVFLTVAALLVRDFARSHGLRLLAAAGVIAPFAAIAAPLFDAAENIIWLLLIDGHGGDGAAMFATACASIKFALVGLAILYGVWGLLSWLRHRRRPVT